MIRRNIFLIAFLTFVSAAGFAYWQNQTPQRLCAQYIKQTDLGMFQTRGVVRTENTENLNQTLADVSQAIQEKDYLRAEGVLTSVLEAQENHPQANLLMGILQLQTDRLAQALVYLNQAYANKTDQTYLDASWFLALVHLRNNSIEQARPHLRQVVAQRGNYQNQAKELLDTI